MGAGADRCFAGRVGGLAVLVLAAACATRAPQAPGGGVRSFIQAPAALEGEDYKRFRAGRELFAKRWTAAEGLGPRFDAKSCLVCHPRGGGGRPLSSAEATADNASTIVRFAEGQGFYGHQLQRRAGAGQAGEGLVSVAYSETSFVFADGETVRLRQPHYTLSNPAHGIFPQRFSVLIAPKVAGSGLLEAVAESSIRAGADPSDRDGDGISGRLALTGEGRVGRFGWRGDAVSITDQVSRAFAFDMGLSSGPRPDPNGDCVEACGGRGTIEVSEERFAALVAFTAALLPPPPRTRGALAERGARLFSVIGCAACHRPSFETADPAQTPIRPYSDLLLHDMGPALGDAVSPEWRTAPLWGLTRRREVHGEEFYLHDGRARSLAEALLWHGGEAARAKAAFVALSRGERGALLAFLDTL